VAVALAPVSYAGSALMSGHADQAHRGSGRLITNSPCEAEVWDQGESAIRASAWPRS
jgi:hypothetical protein